MGRSGGRAFWWWGEGVFERKAEWGRIGPGVGLVVAAVHAIS